jgi:endonuclease-3 related protein
LSRWQRIGAALERTVTEEGRQLGERFRQLSARYGRQQWWPGDTPFEVAVGAVLTQNTSWSGVERAIASLLAEDALDPQRIAAMSSERLAAIIRPCGYFNVKAKRLQALVRWWLDRGGFAAIAALPTDQLRRQLLSVNGIGPESADDILLYAFERPVFVIDAYTRRIFLRLGLAPAAASERPTDYEQWRHWFERHLPPEVALYNEYHALIVAHAKQHCRTRPRCSDCPLAGDCPVL